MAFAWKAAGLTYNRYIAVASRAVRRSLKEEQRIVAEKRADSEIRIARWENGKQGDLKDLNRANEEAMKQAATQQSS